MNFIDLLFEDDGITLSPFTLFSIGKRSLFRKAGKLKPSILPLKKAAKTLSLKKDIASEKLSATFSKDSGVGKDSTLYALTDEQVEVMENILQKYGYDIYKEIKKFRKNVLAPYETIKRHVKKNSRVTAKEVYGLTREEFLAAYESGRKKIENMGNKFVESSRNIAKKIEGYEDTLKDIENIKQKFLESGEYNEEVLERLFSRLGVGIKNFGTKLEGDKEKSYSLKKISKILNNYDKITQEINKHYSKENIEEYNRRIKELETDTKKTWEEKHKEAEKIKNEFNKAGMKKFDAMIGALKDSDGKSLFSKKAFRTSYLPLLMRRSIMDRFKSMATENGNKDYYYYFYLKLISEWADSVRAHKSDRIEDLKNLNDNLEFTENEAKIFKLKHGADKYSSNINDYKQMIKIEDFPEEAYIPIKKDPELVRAMDKFEREIRKFENKLKEIMSDEDVALLKKYRLINNLIKVRELEDPESLFKSEDEIERIFKTSPKKESEMEYNVETREKDTYYIRQIEDELEKAKRFKKMKDENRFRAQKVKIRNLIREFRRVDIKANKKLSRFANDFDDLNFSILYSKED